MNGPTDPLCKCRSVGQSVLRFVLPVELQPQLDIPRSDCRTRGLSKRCRRDARVGAAGASHCCVAVVEGVDEQEFEIQGLGSRKNEMLRGSEVHVPEAGSVEVDELTELPGRRRR